MKKYTIIYTRSVPVGSHRIISTHFARVETDNLIETLKNDEYEEAVFVFLDWPLLVFWKGRKLIMGQELATKPEKWLDDVK